MSFEGKNINNFLRKINISEDSFEEYKDSIITHEYDKTLDKLTIDIDTDSIKSPKANFEIFIKSTNKLKEEGFSVSRFTVRAEVANDQITVYENILYFIQFNEIDIDLKLFQVKHVDEKFIIETSNEEVRNKFEHYSGDLNKYLNTFSIIDSFIKIEVNENSMDYGKLEEVIEQSISESYNEVDSTKQLKNDEKIWEKYNLLDTTLREKQTNIYFEGYVVDFQSRVTKNGKKIFEFTLGNGANAVSVVIIANENENLNLKSWETVRVYGKYDYSDFASAYQLSCFSTLSVQKISEKTLGNLVEDKSEYERPEFHVHTKMSTLDGVSNVSEYIAVAEAYGLSSITITDHNSTQSFPDAFNASKKTNVKVNYGVELDVYDDVFTEVVINGDEERELISSEYVIFDLETTSVTALTGEIIEFGAVKYKENMVIDRKQMFFKPSEPISEFTTSLTGITNDDVANAPLLVDVISEIKEWIGDSILVAHNASFDYNFLNRAYIVNGLGEIKNPVIDTMKISWAIHPNSRNHRLGTLAKHEFVAYDTVDAHRADYDAEVLSKVFERLLHKLSVERGIRTLNQINELMPSLKDYIFTGHITMIAKNQKGLRDINKFVSDASTVYFNKRKKSPMLPLSMFYKKELFENVLIGSACSKGFLFQSIQDSNEPKIEKLLEIYDYLEIFVPSSYDNLIIQNQLSERELRDVLRRIIKIGEEKNIPVIASSNAHYSTKDKKMIRDVIINSPRVGNSFHPLVNFSNRSAKNPDAHLRTTTEMFEEFNSFLSDDKSYELIIKNPRQLQLQIEEDLKPIHDKLYTPTIPGVDEIFKETIQKNLKKTYGEDINPIILERIQKEQDSIIKHGFAVIYYLSAVAVQKSMDDGYLVGSRGSVGSSLAATMSGITEVNPLDAHYICDKCKFHEFVDGYASGYDLPEKNCPVCGEMLRGEGHSIPFETFLGFNADKVPDIDLNFSRENQSSIHLFIKEFLGEDKVFRAGTISTAAFKTAVGYARKYFEDTDQESDKATLEWIAANIEGTKRTSGQHPGGLIVIPTDMDVYDFTPIQFPGDDYTADWKTTHFDFHSIHDNLLKLDLLGHLDPSSIRMLQNLTNIDPQSIPMNDKTVISLFSNNNMLGYDENHTGEELGIIGLPEFGTKFVRDLVREAKPKTFADLVRISGLSHGTDVWAGNAQDLIKHKTATLAEVISVRDDIMTYLIGKGIENLTAFKMMESVRKGNGLTPEWESIMVEHNVPAWYITSCKLIKYMFPKAHATAYVMMAYRIAWYKINYPLEYYATYFSKRDIEIDLSRIVKGINEMKRHYSELQKLSRMERQKKDDDLMETYNIVFEMYSRGIEFETIDINKSLSTDFRVNKENNTLIPPFSVIEKVGESVADKCVQERNKGEFVSIKDFETRSSIPKQAIATIKALGGTRNLPEDINSSEQLNLFG